MVDLKITKKSFIDKENEKEVIYYECIGLIKGVEVKFKPDALDKSIFKYLMQNSKFNDKGDLI